jgi:hypothetical protein
MKKNVATTTTEAAAVAEQGAKAAPETTPSTKGATSKKGAPKGQKTAKGAKAAKPATKPAAKKEAKPASKNAAKNDAAVPREFSKKATVIEMLRRKDGATLAEIAKATDWQNHSIRGFISGTLTKKMALKVESAKNEAGERTYRIT